MSVEDFHSSSFDADTSRYERESRLNPSILPSGLESNFDGTDNDLLSNSLQDVGDNNMGDYFNDFGGSGFGNDSFGGGFGNDSFGGGFGGGGFGNDSFGGGFGNDSFGGGFGNDSFGGGGFGNFGQQGGIYGNNFGQQQQQPQQPKSKEDMMFEMATKSGTAIKEATTDLIHNSQTNSLFKVEWGRSSVIYGGVFIVLGIVTKLLGLQHGLQMTVAGFMGAATGALLWGFNEEKSHSEEPMFTEDNNTAEMNMNSNGFNNNPFDDPYANSNPFDDPYANSNPFDDPYANSNPFDDPYANSNPFDDNYGASSSFDDDPFEEPSVSDNDDDISFDDEPDEDEFNFDDVDDEPETEDISNSQQGLSTEDALATMGENVPVNVYTRQYLYDMFVKRLPNYKADFSDMKSIDEDSDMFIEWGDYLREASEVSGVKEENLPELLELKQNLFSIILTCSRTAGFKADQVGDELARMYEQQVCGDNEEEGVVFAKTKTAGQKATITIFLGTKALISLKDMLQVSDVKEYVLNTKNYMPVIIGTNQLGNVIYTDFKKIESVLITGMPRSGKSWFVQQTLTQMCAFVPPSELNLYICDPKDGISDFKSFCLPHVKKFVSGDDNIVNTIRQIVRVEAPRRKQIIGGANCVNIWDYRDLHPEVDLPLIYIVIDEVVTLAERMEKDVKAEFQGLLLELISQLPALGIRALLIPHEVKNDVIKKTTTDLIQCRISVLGDANHIESSTGTKPKDFPYKLTSQGDMAVKIPLVNPNTMYVHAPALTDDNNENSRVFDYMRQVWKKLEPSSYTGAIVDKAELDNANQELLESIQDDNILNEDIDLYDEDDDLSNLLS